MAVITINIPDEQVVEAERIARALTREYGVPVSRSEVVRRALRDFFISFGSTDSPDDTESTAEQAA